jgi:hypothetical protein
MSVPKIRWLGLAVMAISGAGLLAMTSMMNSAFAFGDDTALIMGGTGIGAPNPSPGWVIDANELYVAPHFPGYTPQGLVTPEELYPLTGIHSLTLDTSLAQGVTILNNAILQNFADNNETVVLGYSQSATIASLELDQLATVPSADRPDPSQLAFVLLGDPNNPNGGFFERFDGLSAPSLGVTFSGATPADLYPTDIYTLEYDAAADFPQYPIDLPADLNAVAGFLLVHGTYPDLTPAQIDSAIPLATAGDTMTNYYMIPVDNLPLLEPLRLIPVIGNPLADLIQPDLQVIVNLGYGSITDGWSQGPANVPTPFELFPTDISPTAVFDALLTGAQQGVQNFVTDLGSLSLSDPALTSVLNSLKTALDATDTLSGGGVATSGGDSLTDIVNTLSSVVSTDLGVLLPTADIGLAAITTLPAYDASLFVSGLDAGNLLDALGDPIAADLGLIPMAALVELGTIAEAAATTIDDLASLIP